MRDERDIILKSLLNSGFVAAGYVAAGDSQTTNIFEEWLASGRAAEMSYLERHAQLRRHPSTLHPDVCGLIVVAARYVPCLKGYYAGYAKMPDYHAVLREHLRKATTSFKPRGRIRICVDSAPLPEREWALRAGIGWRGKQGALVHPAWGPCIFLAALLLDTPACESLGLRKEDDKRESLSFSLSLAIRKESLSAGLPECGNCDLCVKACPNSAFGSDGLLDARRCAAYWTVEHKGVIPGPAVKYVRRRLLGCDICMAVCPFNPSPAEQAGVFPEFAQLPRKLPDPAECLSLTEDGFKEIFQGTSLIRLGLDRLQRNALIVLYNEGGDLSGITALHLTSLAKRQLQILLK